MTDKERITEILKAYTKKHNIMASSVILEEYAEELLANGVIVPPCKVGDLVYVIRRKEKRNKGGYWNSICFTKKVMQTAIKHGTAYIDCKRATKTDFSLIGKTVFLTREEAEKALERSKGNA